MGWMQLAMLAAGLAKTNKETQEAENAAMRKSVSQRGDWIFPSNASNEAVPVPNGWGNLLAGTTAASQMNQQNRQAAQQDKYLDVLSSRKRGVVGDIDYNFSVPSASSFQMPTFGSGLYS